ncbi:MAG: SemiSWEET transporter [Methanomassiliicoccales archaeon]|nr:SemiSWEET transporter [Methanomassiliicoccales archaeon]
MDDWLMLGVLAGFLTTIGFVPQIIKGYRTRRMEDVSLLMPMVLGSGMLLWLLYGLSLGNLPIIIWNAIAFALNMGVVGLKLKYSRDRSACQ